MPLEYRAYRTELRPNNRQKSQFARHAGTARWAFNWGLARRNHHYDETGEALTAIDLHREIIAMKKTPEFSWLREVSKCAAQYALRDLDQAFKNYFRSIKTGQGRWRRPRFKKRSVGRGSFRLEGTFHAGSNWIQLPKIGRVRLKERDYFPTDRKIINATVSERAGRWFCSIKIREEIPAPAKSENQATVGVDVGLARTAVLSDGTICPNPNHHNGSLRRLRLLSKSVARKKPGSHNWYKAIQRLRRHHYRVACRRADHLHKLTTYLIRHFGLIGIETLNVRGMRQNRCLAKRAYDSAIYELYRQLEYKAERARVRIVKADLWYPSSQLCSRCGHQHKELHLRDRTFCCPACGLELDRDVNAARNLRALALTTVQNETAAGAVAAACGDSVSLGFDSAAVGEAGSQLDRVVVC